MSTFNLPNASPAVLVTLPTQLSQSQLLAFPAFKTWHSTLTQSLQQQHILPSHPFHSNPYVLRAITVQAVDFFGQRVGFVKLNADVSNSAGESLPGLVFLRGGSVAMLILLRDDASEDEHVLLTVQARVPVGSLAFTELPAGMIDDSGTFSGAAAKEIAEETGLEIAEDDLVDMTALAVSSNQISSEPEEAAVHLQRAMYPSPGGCDEFISVFLARKTMARGELDALRGKLTGLRDEGEKIQLRLCRVDELWKVGARDGKTLAAVALYQGLKREGKV